MTTTTQAAGTLRTTSWKEEPFAGFHRRDATRVGTSARAVESGFAEVDGAPKLSHDRVAHTFTGDIEGEGTWQGLNAYRDEATADFAGYERVVGRLGRRSGSFVLQVSGTYQDGETRVAWSVVPGTGELRGIHGEGTYVAVGSFEDGYAYRLDYRFE